MPEHFFLFLLFVRLTSSYNKEIPYFFPLNSVSIQNAFEEMDTITTTARTTPKKKTTPTARKRFFQISRRTLIQDQNQRRLPRMWKFLFRCTTTTTTTVMKRKTRRRRRRKRRRRRRRRRRKQSHARRGRRTRAQR